MNSQNKTNKFLSIICIISAAVFLFVSGYLTASLLKGKSVRSYEWIVNTINDNYYQDVDQDLLTEYAMNGGVQDLLDAYSAYYTREEYQAMVLSNSGTKSGIGVTYSFVEGKGVLLNSVIGNSPAYKSGLRRGVFLSSGLEDTGEFTNFTSSATFTAYINGFDVGENMTLYDDSQNVYTVAKSQYTASYARLCTNATSWGFTDSSEGSLALIEEPSEKMPYLPQGVGYISLSQFYGTATWEISKLVEKFNEYNCTSLILDLRDNGGGYLSIMQELTYTFTAEREIEDNVAAYAEYKNGSKKYFSITENRNYAVLPAETEVYVLANDGTASASEALIGALISYDVIEYSDIYISEYSDEYIQWVSAYGGVKNGTTYGKGIMQSTFINLQTGEALKLTTAKIYWPNGECIHGVGLNAAQGCNTVYADWSVTLNDEELQRAVEKIF